MLNLQAGYQEAIRKAQAETGMVPATYSYTPHSSGTVSATPTSTFISRGQTVNSYDTSLPYKTTPAPIVPAGYNINTDPTYSGTIGADTGYKGTPMTGGNVGPSKGESWSGGTARSDGTMAGGSNVLPYKSFAQRIQEAGDNAVNGARFGHGASTEQIETLRQQAIATEAAKIQIEQQEQAQATADAQRRAKESGGSTTQAFSDSRLTSRLNTQTGDRQSYIEKRRSEGATDQKIRTELTDGTFKPTPTIPPNAPPSTQTTETSTGSPSGTNTAGTGTPPTGGTQTPPSAQTGGTNTSTNPNVPPAVNPTSTMFRNLAANAIDPIEKLMMSSYADMIDASPAGGAQMSFSDYMASAEARSVAQGYNDANSILSEYQSTVKASTASRQQFSQDQFDRNDAYLAAAQANAHAQLSFANDRDARDLAESNRKNLNAMSNALSLQGGFGSAGGNMEVLEAQQKGERAIVDLNKEYGFKHTDVSLQFTQFHNEAQDKFTSSWLDALDNFDAKIADIATQKNANETSKRAALKSAYTERNKAVTDANLAHAKAINDATKGVTEYANKLRDDARTETKDNKDNAYQMFNFAYTNSADPAMRKAAVEQMRAAGYNLPTNIDYTSLTPDQQIRMMDLVEKQKTAMSSLNPVDFEGEAKSVAMMAANVQLNLTDSDKAVFAQNQAPQIASLLHQGKTEEAKKIIYDAAVTNLSQSRKDVADRRAMVSYLDYAIGRLESAKDLPGFYTGKWNDAQKYFGQQQNAEYRDIASVVALASVESLHELYGSALTETEMETARTILPLKGSNMLDAIQQLKNFRAYQNNKQEQIVQGISGGGAFGPGSNGGTTSNKPTNEGMGNIMNGGEETTIETSMVNNKRVTGRLSAIAALERANSAMIADGLEGLDVNSSFRNTAQQTAAYERFQRGEIARAAKPGTSLHESGLAFDITNWKQAEKYLKAQGFNPLPANLRSSDPAHFSFIHIG